MAGLATSPPYTLDVRRKRDDVPGSVDEERQALFEQRRALELLKEQLSERVVAVQEREAELRAALATVRGGGTADIDVTLPPAPAPVRDDARARELDARQRSLDELAATLAVREAELARRSAAADDPLAGNTEELEHRSAALDQRSAELDRREAELRVRAATALPAAPGADLDARLEELRAAEKAFMRTREELAARAEAVTARERLVAERERELHESTALPAGGDVSELEARLRRLEAQRTAPAAGQQGFSGGFRRLEQEGTRGRAS